MYFFKILCDKPGKKQEINFRLVLLFINVYTTYI